MLCSNNLAPSIFIYRFFRKKKIYINLSVLCILFDSISTFFYFIFLVKEMGRFSIPPPPL